MHLKEQRTFVLLMACCVMFCVPALMSRGAPIHNDLQLHATLDTADRSDDGSPSTDPVNGETLFDISGNNHDGTVRESSGETVDHFGGGRAGEALSLAGDGHLDFGRVLDPGTGSYTASIWLRTTASQGSVFGKGHGVTSEPGWLIWYRDQAMNIRINDDDGNDDSVSDSLDTSGLAGGPIDDGDWHHLALVIDRTGDSMIGYYDGAPFPTNPDISGVGSIQLTSADLISGVRWRGGGRDFGLEGEVDDLGIWSRTLSGSEIEQVYEGGLRGVNISQLPEPTAFVLLLLGGLLALNRRRS
jgi:hypothetical protein